MLTILIRHKNTKREVIYPADEVEFEEDDGLRFHTKDGCGMHLKCSDSEQDYRDVFIMNDAGQTVARYLL